MKIGILTLHWVPNFGANLQSLASLSVLKKLGHEVTIIDYRPKKMYEMYKNNIPKKQKAMHNAFLNEYIPLSPKTYFNYEDLKADVSNLEFDLVLSGSDALFRLKPEMKDREDFQFPNPFWLNWTFDKGAKVKKRGFLSVSSMGTNYAKLSSAKKSEMKNYLSKFNVISVRDNWTKKMVNLVDPNLKVKETIDPVFLLNDNFTIPEELMFNYKQPYILLCINPKDISNNWLSKFVKIANKRGYKTLSIPNPEGHTIKAYVDDYVEYPIHPLKWYSAIANSSGYIGVRFHPIVSCIENNIPFVALDQYNNYPFNKIKSKTYDITKKTGFEKNCIAKKMISFYSAEKVFNMLMSQKRNEHDKIERLKNELLSYLNTLLE